MNVDPSTGEVIETTPGFDVVPLNIAILDEHTLAQWAPTPGQAAGALGMARVKNLAAPAALAKYRKKLRDADREKKIALGLAVQKLREEYGHKATMTELRELAYGVDERLQKALDDYDDAWLMFEYAKDFAEAIERDVSLLQSITKSLSGDHR